MKTNLIILSILAIFISMPGLASESPHKKSNKAPTFDAFQKLLREVETYVKQDGNKVRTKTTLQHLFDYGIKTGLETDQTGNTFFHYACEGVHVEVDKTSPPSLALVAYFLKKPEVRASINCTNEYKETPLHYAVSAGSLEVVQALLDAGADPLLRRYDDETPLIIAAARNVNPAIAALLAAKGDINSVDVTGATALHWATAMSSIELIRVLLKAGANPNVISIPQTTPFSNALARGDRHIIELLNEYNARPDEWDRQDDAVAIEIEHVEPMDLGDEELFVPAAVTDHSSDFVANANRANHVARKKYSTLAALICVGPCTEQRQNTILKMFAKDARSGVCQIDDEDVYAAWLIIQRGEFGLFQKALKACPQVLCLDKQCDGHPTLGEAIFAHLLNDNKLDVLAELLQNKDFCLTDTMKTRLYFQLAAAFRKGTLSKEAFLKLLQDRAVEIATQGFLDAALYSDDFTTAEFWAMSGLVDWNGKEHKISFEVNDE